MLLKMLCSGRSGIDMISELIASCLSHLSTVSFIDAEARIKTVDHTHEQIVLFEDHELSELMPIPRNSLYHWKCKYDAFSVVFPNAFKPRFPSSNSTVMTSMRSFGGA